MIFLDETMLGEVVQEMDIATEASELRLREVIMLRVEEEIRRQHDEHIKRYFTGFPDLSHAERLLMPRKPSSEQPDPEAYGYRALEAFKRNAFFVLVDDRQVDDLEQVLTLRPDSRVSFVRLTPLVGG